MHRFLSLSFSAFTTPILAFALCAHSAHACAILTLVRDGEVLVGNNEDFIKPGVIWFVPGKKGRYGRVNFGFDDGFAQGSMNEMGLCFDAAVVAKVPWEADPEKESPKNLLEKIMNECATVDEGIAYFERYNCKHLAESQFLLADATGASAVVTWVPQSGLSITRRETDFLLATNVRLEMSGYRCQRHTKATQVLTNRGGGTRETVAAALEAIHQHGPGAFTSYSTVYDLKRKLVHVYNAANFDDGISFDLESELGKKRQRTRELATLFASGKSVDTLRDMPQRTTWDTRVTLSAETLARYAGRYSPTPEITVRIERNDSGGLTVHNPGQGPAELFPESETKFRIAPDRGQVSFELDPSGHVRGLTLHKQADVYAERLAV